MLATEIMQLLRERFGKEEIASALLAADKTLVEKKRKRKREAALQVCYTADIQSTTAQSTTA